MTLQQKLLLEKWLTEGYSIYVRRTISKRVSIIGKLKHPKVGKYEYLGATHELIPALNEKRDLVYIENLSK